MFIWQFCSPAAVGKPDDFVLFGKGAIEGYTGKAYEQNKGLDANNDGSVTKAEASAKVQQYKGVRPEPATVSSILVKLQTLIKVLE